MQKMVKIFRLIVIDNRIKVIRKTYPYGFNVNLVLALLYFALENVDGFVDIEYSGLKVIGWKYVCVDCCSLWYFFMGELNAVLFCWCKCLDGTYFCDVGWFILVDG